ncbi:site-specific tyrosine recombinase XerC [compost metagenome]
MVRGQRKRSKVDSKTMAIFKTWFAAKPDNIHKLVFYSPGSKYKVLCNGGANKALAARLEALAINPITIHGLRHTHASILLYRSISIYYVSERLGHKSIEITLKHYAHIVKELRKKDEKSTLKTIEGLMA